MLDQNTDRMWYVIGAVLIGAALILGANTLFPGLMSSVSTSFISAMSGAVMIPDEDVYLAQDDDFIMVYGNWTYIGSETVIEIPHTIQGDAITTYDFMFTAIYDGFEPESTATAVTKVVSTNPNVTSMDSMFAFSKSTSLDLSGLDTSNVDNMGYMFQNVVLDVLDLSSFDTSKVTYANNMFENASIGTAYAGTETDADLFNGTRYKPASITFQVK